MGAAPGLQVEPPGLSSLPPPVPLPGVGLVGPCGGRHRAAAPRDPGTGAHPPQSLWAELHKAWGINLKQLIASERSHQRLNKHNLTEGMIIDLVKKRKKGKLN